MTRRRVSVLFPQCPPQLQRPGRMTRTRSFARVVRRMRDDLPGSEPGAPALESWSQRFRIWPVGARSPTPSDLARPLLSPASMKRLALCLAMLLPISSSLSGCSWIFVQPLPPRHESGDRTACTTNRAAPVIDTILTLTHVTSAIYVAGQDNVTNKGPAVTAGLLVGAMWLSSAIYG